MTWAAPRLHQEVRSVSGSQGLRPGLLSAHRPQPQLLLSLHDGEVSKPGVVATSSHHGLTPAPCHHPPPPAITCHCLPHLSSSSHFSATTCHLLPPPATTRHHLSSPVITCHHPSTAHRRAAPGIAAATAQRQRTPAHLSQKRAQGRILLLLAAQPGQRCPEDRHSLWSWGSQTCGQPSPA